MRDGVRCSLGNWDKKGVAGDSRDGAGAREKVLAREMGRQGDRQAGRQAGGETGRRGDRQRKQEGTQEKRR